MANEKNIDLTGLDIFKSELDKKYQLKESGKGLSTNDYTTDEKNKLSSIANGAQANVIETVKVNGTALTPSSKAVDITVPTKTSELTNNSNFVSDASYVHTDNNYTATEKSKLSGIASGAEVNQNAFSNVGVKVGNTITTVAADAKTDTVTLIQGSNVTLTADTTNDTVTIAAKDTTYSAATTTAAGLMSADDKTKLNGIAAGAEANVNADWNATSGDAQILNKPTIPAAVAVKGNAESSYRTGNVNITPANIGLGNVGNFKAVSTVASQGLTDTEKNNARTNIGAGTSSFSGSYNDLSDKPTIPAAAANGTYTIKTLVESTKTNVSDFTANQSSADDLTIAQGANVFIYPDSENRTITIAARDTTYECLPPINGSGVYSLVTCGEKYTWGTLYDCTRHANNGSFESVPNNRPGVMMTTSSDFPYNGTQWFWIHKSYSGTYGICKLIYLGSGSVGYKNGETWIRTLYNGTWQNWTKVFDGQ